MSQLTGTMKAIVKIEVIKIGWSWRKPFGKSVTLYDDVTGSYTTLYAKDTLKLNIAMKVGPGL